MLIKLSITATLFSLSETGRQFHGTGVSQVDTSNALVRDGKANSY